MKNNYVLKLFGTFRMLIVLLILLSVGVQVNTTNTNVLSLLTPISLAPTDAIGSMVTSWPAGVTGTWALNILTTSGTPSVLATNTYAVVASSSASAAVTTVCYISEIKSNLNN
jgi:hypothetical protein